MTSAARACPCGEIHLLAAHIRAAYDQATAGKPSTVKVVSPGGTWLVPRIFLAAHGVKATELPALAERYGFEAVR